MRYRVENRGGRLCMLGFKGLSSGEEHPITFFPKPTPALLDYLLLGEVLLKPVHRRRAFLGGEGVTCQ